MFDVIKKYTPIYRSLLRVPTYLLLSMYLAIGTLLPQAINANPAVSYKSLLLKTVLNLIILALWYINATSLNDWSDFEIDKINLKGDKDRPLIIGSANKSELIKTAYVSGGLTLIIAATLSGYHLAITAILLILNLCYSIRPIRLSYRGIVAPLLLPTGYVVLPVLLGYFNTSHSPHKLLTLVMASLYAQFFGRIILKDYRDVKGDAKHGKLTFLLRHGNKTVASLAAVGVATSTFLLLMCKKFLPILDISTLALTGYGLAQLYALSQTTTWADQKPILSAFGRSMTGISASLIISLVYARRPVGDLQITVMSVMIAAAYIWSAKEAFSYNKLMMQNKN